MASDSIGARTLIRGGTIVDGEDGRPADVMIVDERIVAVGADLPPGDADNVVDAGGLLVLPGLVDSHTHLDCPSRPGLITCDDFDTGTRAALAGGTTTIVDFAYQTDGSLEAGLDAWLAKASGRAHIDFGFHLAVTEPSPAILAELPSLVARGVTSFKLFMCERNGIVLDADVVADLLGALESSGGLLQVHAEDGAAIGELARECRAGGLTAPIGHARSHPVETEVAAIREVIAAVRSTQRPAFIVHVSSAAAVEEIRQAQGEGLPLYAETCVHYLALTVDELARPGFEGAKFVCSPPLRDKADQDELWRALGDGTLQICSSDHCPYNFHGQKDRGLGDFTKIPPGLPTIEHRLNLLWNFGVATGRLSTSDLVRVASTQPARMFDLAGKGRLAPGYDADVVLFDPTGSTTISVDRQTMNVDYTPFEGLTCAGRVVRVMSRGDTVVLDGQVLSRPGRGRYLTRGLGPFGPGRLTGRPQLNTGLGLGPTATRSTAGDR